jgi:glycosyltransferase involved in cell wall biosynthesis
MKILTISIAAYNIEKYIEECLNSFISEQLYETLEVLVINDGSTDKTADIAQKYVEKHPDIFKLINKANGGHGSTINIAVKIATGKYFKPVDGDDWVDTDNLICIIDKLKDIDADLIITDFYHYYSKSGIKELAAFDSNHHEIRADFSTFFQENIENSLVYHNITYKTALLKQNNISVSEKVFFEDTEFVLFPMRYVNTLYYIPLPLYYYRLDREGQSVSIEGIIKHKADLQQVIKNIFIFYKNNKNDKNKKKYYKTRILLSLEFYYKAACTEAWIAAEKKNKNKKENIAFYRDILSIAPSLFLCFISKRKIRILQFITFFRFDSQLIRIRRFLKGNFK